MVVIEKFVGAVACVLTLRLFLTYPISTKMLLFVCIIFLRNELLARP